MDCLCMGRRRARDIAKREIVTSKEPITPSIPLDQVAASHNGGLTSTSLVGHPRDGLIPVLPSHTSENNDKTCNADIIAIHGLNGHPFKTWTFQEADGGRKCFWLKDLLLERLPGARIFTYSYNAAVSFSDSISSLHDWAENLLECLMVERNQPPELQSRPIVFICHSLGGLVCKKALIRAHERQHYSPILRSTKAIFFFGTPHRGSEFANHILRAAPLLDLVDNGFIEFFGGQGRLVRQDLIDNLTTKAPILDDLTRSFVERADELSVIVSFQETRKIRGQMIVTFQSSKLDIAKERLYSVDADHRGMCRLHDENQTVFKIIVQECQRLKNLKAQTDGLSQQLYPESLTLLQLNKPEWPMSEPTEGTCEWFFTFQQQQLCALQKGRVRLVWIAGELGCGKTTLLSFLKSTMAKRNPPLVGFDQGATAKATVCSFFCNENNRELGKAITIIKTLIYDILFQHGQLLHLLKERAGNSGDPWRRDQLLEVFKVLLKDPSVHYVYIIIDAFDECDRKERINLLEDLVSCTQQSGCSVTFIISTRTLQIRATSLVSCSFDLEYDKDRNLQKLIQDDITTFLRCDLEHESQFSQSLIMPSQLASIIAKKARCSFLWASHVLEDLREGSIISDEDVDQYMAECPDTLGEIYYQALTRVKPKHQKRVLKSLHILLAATRPLSILEFKTAVAIQDNHRTLDHLQRPFEDSERMIHYLRENLGSMVRIGSSSVTLRHQAVKDFLLNKLANFSNPWSAPDHVRSPESVKAMRILPEDAELTLAMCCNNFLYLDDFRRGRRSSNEIVDDWEDAGFDRILRDSPSETDSFDSIHATQNKEHDRPPFVQYAAMYWGVHLATSQSSSENVLQSALRLSKEPNILGYWSNIYRRSYTGHDNLPDTLDALVVAAYFGHMNVCECLRQREETGPNLELALGVASRMGHLEFVTFCINEGVDCSNIKLYGVPAIIWAATRGYLAIVEEFLCVDSTLVNILDEFGQTPLMAALGAGQAHVVDRLLEMPKVNVNVRTTKGIPTIAFILSSFASPRQGTELVRKMIYNRSVDITMRDPRGRTILSHAAERGDVELVQVILDCRERKADIRILLDDEGDDTFLGLSPLNYAVRSGHVSIMRMLFETKKIGKQLKNVDGQNGDGPWGIATLRGNSAAIVELAKYYPEGVNQQDKTGRTPISIAMWHDDKKVIRCLMEAGADPRIPDYKGRTPDDFVRQAAESRRQLQERDNARR